MLKLLGAQKENIAAVIISAEEYRIFDGNHKLRQTTTNRKRAVVLVEANRHLGAYCPEVAPYDPTGQETE